MTRTLLIRGISSKSSRGWEREAGRNQTQAGFFGGGLRWCGISKLLSLTLVAVGAAACAASEDLAVDESEVQQAEQWNVNDVSFLFPNPAAAGDGKYLLPVNELLPESLFQRLGEPGGKLPFL